MGQMVINHPRFPTSWAGRGLGALAAAAILLVSGGPTASPATDPAISSLPAVESGARPGPDVLYAPAPAAPQLENRDPRFHAAPLLVSGTEAYQEGEYIYQDHLYDDYGSDTSGTGGRSLSPRTGDITYPTDEERYGGNAADLVEFRIAVGESDVAYRVTLNTLLEPDTTIIAIAFDTDGDPATGSDILSRDPGASFPGTDEALFLWGTGAEHVRFAGGLPLVTSALGITTDLETNQMTLSVPRTVSDPRGLWRTTLATGLYDGAGGWLRPQRSANETTPGGASFADLQPSGIFNLAFRYDEPVLADDVPPDTAQAAALQDHEPTRFSRNIDFGDLDSGASRSNVPETGTMIRIFPSRLDLGEGRDLDASPQYLGQLQPYSLYVPTTYSAKTPSGFTLNLHSLSEHHWQYNGTVGIQQIGESRGNLVATPMARGDDGWYQNEAEYDVFEVWNDVARHYTLDPHRAAVTGYSMGGYGTYRLGTLYPDLFGKAYSVVGPPADGIWIPPLRPTGGIDTLTNVWLENARNVPYLNVVAAADELVPIAGTRAQNLGAPELGVRGFEQLGYRYRFVVYETADHLTLATLNYNVPYAADFLGDATVERNPYHVTFSYAPQTDDAELGLEHTHAYWVSGLRLADPAVGSPIPKATVDALSHGFGLGDPSSSFAIAPGTEPLPYTEFSRAWGEPPAIERENKLTVKLTNIGEATIDTRRALLNPKRDMTLAIDSTSAGQLHLTGRFRRGTTVLMDGVPLPGATVTESGLELPVAQGEHTYSIGKERSGENGSSSGEGSSQAQSRSTVRGESPGVWTAFLRFLARLLSRG
jgi:pimeloyl-ACP methyl ester carboxylesterase